MDIDRQYQLQSTAIRKIKIAIAVLKKKDTESLIRSLPTDIPDSVYADLSWLLIDSILILDNVLEGIDPANYDTQENFDERERWAKSHLPQTNT